MTLFTEKSIKNNDTSYNKKKKKTGATNKKKYSGSVKTPRPGNE